MKKIEKILIASITGIVLISSGIYFYFSYPRTFQPNLAVTDTKTKTETPEKIDPSNIKYEKEITGIANVYDFMNQLRVERKIDFKEKDYLGMGKFITEINGIKNNNNKSWIYYVNGEEAQVGVSNYKIKVGDIISWRYE